MDERTKLARGKKRRREEEDGCDGGVDVDERTKLARGKKRRREDEPLTNRAVKYYINTEPSQKKIGITLYGWEWYLPESDGAVGGVRKSQGGWFVNPKNCVEEAEKQKPTDRSYKMCTFTRKKYMTVNNAMFDAAVGKLVEKSAINMLEIGSVDNVDGDIYEKHGADILAEISFGDIFETCKRAIQLYQSFTEADDSWLMNVVCEYTKDGSIFHSLKNQHLNKYFVQLFNYLGW